MSNVDQRRSSLGIDWTGLSKLEIYSVEFCYRILADIGGRIYWCKSWTASLLECKFNIVCNISLYIALCSNSKLQQRKICSDVAALVVSSICGCE
jgi:hypothetical protein